MLPVENSRIVVEALQDFQLAEGPGEYLFKRFKDAHDDIRHVLLEEVDVLGLRALHFLESVDAAVLEIPQLPVVLFSRLASHHQ